MCGRAAQTHVRPRCVVGQLRHYIRSCVMKYACTLKYWFSVKGTIRYQHVGFCVQSLHVLCRQADWSLRY